MKKLVLLSKVEEFKRDDVIGNLNEMEGYVEFHLDPSNWVNEDKALMVDVFFENGHIERLWCSKAVSALVRSEELPIPQIATLPIAIATREDGSQFNQIQMPTGERGEALVVKRNDKVKDFVPAKKKAPANWAKLAKFGV